MIIIIAFANFSTINYLKMLVYFIVFIETFLMPYAFFYLIRNCNNTYPTFQI